MGYDVYYNGEVTVTPALTEGDAAVVRAATNLEDTEETRVLFAAIAASPEPDLPHHAGLWRYRKTGSASCPSRTRAVTDFDSGSS